MKRDVGMKKIIIIVLCLFATLVPSIVSAKEKEKVTIYFFYGEGCPHCHAAFDFFDSIEEEYGKYYEIKSFETWGSVPKSKLNRKLMNKLYKEFGPDVQDSVPYIIIGDKTFLGYDESSNDEIKQAIIEAYEDEARVDKIAPFVKEMIREKNTYYGAWYGSLVLLCVLVVVNEACRAFKK